VADHEQDHEQEKAREHLTDREREALQEFAKAIVRESEIAKLRDPEQEARLEANKLQAEASKTQVLVASGSLVGIATIVGILPTYVNGQLLMLALVAIFGSLTVAFMHMVDVAKKTAAQRHASPDAPFLHIGYLSLCGGLLLFALYVLYNLPLETAEGDPVSIKEKSDILRWVFKFGTVGVVLGVILGGVLVVVRRRLRRRLSRQASRRGSDREDQRKGGA
jgi:hypothetical protein